jgi:NADPH2:quinone reductase
LAHGCEHVLLDGDDIPRRVRELSNGGVPVVYDSVGRTSFYQSLDCLRPHGVLVSFGNSSGKVEPFGLHELTRRGSLYVTRPTLYDFIGERASLESAAAELFSLVENRRVAIEVNQSYALRDAAQAHRDLEARKTTGSTVLIP